nr:unnamed protein product [Haemonchus contortus]
MGAFITEFELIPDTRVEPSTEPRRIIVTLESSPPIIPGRRTIVDILDSKNKTLKSYTLEDHTNEPLIYYVDIIAAEKYFVRVSVNYTEDVVATKFLRDETLERSRSEGMKSKTQLNPSFSYYTVYACVYLYVYMCVCVYVRMYVPVGLTD